MDDEKKSSNPISDNDKETSEIINNFNSVNLNDSLNINISSSNRPPPQEYQIFPNHPNINNDRKYLSEQEFKILQLQQRIARYNELSQKIMNSQAYNYHNYYQIPPLQDLSSSSWTENCYDYLPQRNNYPSSSSSSTALNYNYYDHLPQKVNYDLPGQVFDIPQRRSFNGFENLDGLDHRVSKKKEPRTLDSLRGGIVEAALDQDQCNDLLRILKECSLAERDQIFSEVRHDLCFLTLHQFGNHFVQKLIGVVHEQRLGEVIVIFKGSLRNICTNNYGKNVMVALVERLKGNYVQQPKLIKELCPFAVFFTKNINCKQFLESCLTNFFYENLAPFLRKMAESFMEIATDKIGCRILQTCLRISYKQINVSDKFFRAYMQILLDNAVVLSLHAFGNYVVQVAIEEFDHFKKINEIIAVKFRGKYVDLSMNKHASNVMEKLIKSSEPHVVEQIINDVLSNFLQLCQDHFGNYVVQTMFEIAQAKGLDVFQKMLNFMKENHEELMKDMCGRNIVKRFGYIKHRTYNHYRGRF